MFSVRVERDVHAVHTHTRHARTRQTWRHRLRNSHWLVRENAYLLCCSTHAWCKPQRNMHACCRIVRPHDMSLSSFATTRTRECSSH